MRKRILAISVLLLPFLVASVAAYKLWRTSVQTRVQRADVDAGRMAHVPLLRESESDSAGVALGSQVIQAAFLKAIRAPSEATSEVTAMLAQAVEQVDLKQITQTVATQLEFASQPLATASHENSKSQADAAPHDDQPPSASLGDSRATAGNRCGRDRRGLLRRLLRR